MIFMPPAGEALMPMYPAMNQEPSLRIKFRQCINRLSNVKLLPAFYNIKSSSVVS